MYEKWIDLGLSKGLTDVEIFAVRDKTLEISVYQGQVDKTTKSDVTVVKLKGIYENKLVSVSIEHLSENAVSKAFDQLIENAKAITVEEPAIIFEGSPSYPKIKENDYDFDAVPIENKINYLVDLEKKVAEHQATKQVQSAKYTENFGETHLVNSKGLNLARKHNFAYAYAIGVFEKDGDIKTGYDLKLVKSFEEFDAQKEAQATIETGLAKLGGKSLKTGRYPVVFSNQRFSALLQVFSGLYSGESAYRNLTALKDKVGKKIAVDAFTLVDDPLNEAAPFQNGFDDEGVASYPRKIIDKGVFTGFLHNLKTAALFKEEPTGNAFGGGISPSAMYLQPGTKSFDEMIRDIKEGLYVTELMALHAGVNTSSGDFSLQAGGVLIKEGKLTTPVKMVIVSGNWFELLNRIETIASDLKFEVSGVGSPSVYVNELTVSGEEDK